MALTSHEYLDGKLDGTFLILLRMTAHIEKLKLADHLVSRGLEQELSLHSQPVNDEEGTSILSSETMKMLRNPCSWSIRGHI